MGTPFLSPVTLHLKVKVSPGHVGGAAVNCAATSGEIWNHYVEINERRREEYNLKPKFATDF